MAKRPSPLDRYAALIPEGSVTWIGVRPVRKAPLVSVPQVRAVATQGLEGDHRMTKKPGSGRQITLISEEFIQQIERHLGCAPIDPVRLRRNIVVRGLNLNTLRRQRFWLGNALIEATELCDPCQRMEQELGAGGFNAMLGYGGLCGRIVVSGDITLGCPVKVSLSEEAHS